MENNWRYKSLENLENRRVTVAKDSTTVVKRCTQLFGKPLNEYSIEDMRIMLGQQFGLDYLIPLVLEQLKIDILSEGDYYPGDLLTAILKVNITFWTKNNLLLKELIDLIKSNQKVLFKSEIPVHLLGQYYQQ
ncbi:contact-dependent growth inhibition system immunity protein [Mucilaginibacter lutimaris]|uniref:Contact-dependent growth inhibition system immunity protein n=1 Tax=Mucilaginibacter lutimaris TaxID=931629 RepID=A0ABW2ZB17_9SPHI